MRRHWKKLLPAVVLLIFAVLGGGLLWVQAKNRGPTPPVCAGPPLERGSFGAPVQVTRASSPGGYNLEPGAALLPGGGLAAMFMAPNGMFADSTLGVALIAPDGGVEVRPFATGRKQHFDPWMTATSDGKLHAVWLGHDKGMPEHNMEVGHATSTDGLAWTIGPAVHDAAADCPANVRGCLDKPMVVAGPDAQNPGAEAIYALYYSDPGGGLKVTKSVDGGKGFRASVKAGEGAYGSVDLTASGKLHCSTRCTRRAAATRGGIWCSPLRRTAARAGPGFG